MATSTHLIASQENLRCSICLELFVKPRILPCSHSFCHDCLVGCIRKFAKEDKFNCPICRTVIDLKTKVDAICEDFVKCFPFNRTAWALVESANMSKYTHVCNSCTREEGSAIPMYYCFKCNEKLCNDCVKYHSKNKFLSSHKVCKLDDKLDDAADLDYLNKLTKCIEHDKEDVKYFCKDHAALCCNECAIVKHRKCNEVVSITRDINALDPSDFLANITTLEGNVDTLKLHETKQKKNVDGSQTMVKQHLKEQKAKFDNEFAKFEQAVLSNTAEMQKKLLVHIECRLTEINRLEDSLNGIKKKMKVAEDYGQEIHKILIQRELHELVMKQDLKFQNLYKEASCKEITSKNLDVLIDKAVGQLNANSAVTKTDITKPSIPSVYRQISFKVEPSQGGSKTPEESELCEELSFANASEVLDELGDAEVVFHASKHLTKRHLKILKKKSRSSITLNRSK